MPALLSHTRALGSPPRDAERGRGAAPEGWAGDSAEGQRGKHAPLTEAAEQHRWAQTQANTFEQIGTP